MAFEGDAGPDPVPQIGGPSRIHYDDFVSKRQARIAAPFASPNRLLFLLETPSSFAGVGGLAPLCHIRCKACWNMMRRPGTMNEKELSRRELIRLLGGSGLAAGLGSTITPTPVLRFIEYILIKK